MGTAVATVTSRRGRGIVRVDVDLTCTAGAVPAQSIGSFFGRLVGVLTDGTWGPGATMTPTAAILLTDAATGAPVLGDLSFATSDFYRPTRVIADSAGVPVAAATTATNVDRDIYVAGRLNIAIANATTTDTGRVSFIFDESR